VVGVGLLRHFAAPVLEFQSCCFSCFSAFWSLLSIFKCNF